MTDIWDFATKLVAWSRTPSSQTAPLPPGPQIVRNGDVERRTVLDAFVAAFEDHDAAAALSRSEGHATFAGPARCRHPAPRMAPSHRASLIWCGDSAPAPSRASMPHTMAISLPCCCGGALSGCCRRRRRSPGGAFSLPAQAPFGNGPDSRQAQHRPSACHFIERDAEVRIVYYVPGQRTGALAHMSLRLVQ
jgi:hypothetical protein